MSTAIVRAEIERFLKSSVPEVLCISGPWGVGKTFSWQKFLREMEAGQQLAMPRYAYVSLFGLNSLAELRSSVVENTIVAQGPLMSPDAATLHAMLRKGEKYVRQGRPALEVAAGFFRLKDAGDALYRAAFLTVRDQLICFDDLERAGDNLKIMDVLGLASMLREQRGCKVVLLLNKSEAESEQQTQLDKHLEKVVDTFLMFEPTSAEAVAIAIDGSDHVAAKLRERVVLLGITNIRVIKKIERWARQLEVMLAGSDEAMIDQAVTTVCLAGWCFLQPGEAPPLGFLRKFNSMSGVFQRTKIAADEQMWRSKLQEYGYNSTDELDALIVDGVSVGYFRQPDLGEVAAALAEQHKRQSRDNSFSSAWNLYHHSVSVEDEVVLDAMEAGANENLADITPVNMNGTVRFLSRYGRNQEASEIIQSWIEANRDKPGFFSRPNWLFFDDPVDDELHDSLESGRNETLDERDPAEALKAMAKSSGFNPVEDVALLSKLSIGQLVALFDGNSGDELKSMMEWASRLAKQAGADAFHANLDAALLKIAERSPMRADRLRSWGVLPEQPAPLPKDVTEAKLTTARKEGGEPSRAGPRDV